MSRNPVWLPLDSLTIHKEQQTQSGHRGFASPEISFALACYHDGPELVEGPWTHLGGNVSSGCIPSPITKNPRTNVTEGIWKHNATSVGMTILEASAHRQVRHRSRARGTSHSADGAKTRSIHEVTPLQKALVYSVFHFDGLHAMSFSPGRNVAYE